MSIATFADLPLPHGPRFTQANSESRGTSRQAKPRLDLIRQIRAELHRGTYDRPQAVANRLDACVDRVLADVLARG